MSNTYYGEFGGQFVSESLMNTLAELEKHLMRRLKTRNLLRIIIII